MKKKIEKNRNACIALVKFGKLKKKITHDASLLSIQLCCSNNYQVSTTHLITAITWTFQTWWVVIFAWVQVQRQNAEYALCCVLCVRRLLEPMGDWAKVQTQKRAAKLWLVLCSILVGFILLLLFFFFFSELIFLGVTLLTVHAHICRTQFKASPTRMIFFSL